MNTLIFFLDVPSAPRTPTSVSGMTDDSLVLSWVAPEKDGGSKIIEYIVEIRETSTTTWKQVGVSTGSSTNILVTKLVKGGSYEFRICARNEAGCGAWLETEDKITVGSQISEYKFTEKNLLNLYNRFIFNYLTNTS